MFGEDQKAKFALYLGIFLTFFGYAGRYAGVEPVYNQFFPFAAWSYILLADNLSWRFKGSSLLVSRTGEFFFLAALSAALCALAELLNLRLAAWGYINAPSDLGMRWGGRLLGWASVLPSLFVTAELLASMRLFDGARSRSFKLTQLLRDRLGAAGAIMIALAIIAPGWLWPLAVPAVFLLAEQANIRLGLASLMRELAGGLPARTLRLLAAGVVCGVLWNWWNKAGGSGWEYYLPAFLSKARWAALPGFPVLALSAYSLASLASWLRGGKSWEEGTWTNPGDIPAPAVRLAAGLIFIISSYIALRAVDAYTVKLYLGWL